MKLSGNLVLLLCFMLASSATCAPHKYESAEGVTAVASDTYTQDAPVADFQKTLETIKAGLQLVQLIPSDTDYGKKIDAVIVLSQALQNRNPILQSAIERAMKHMTYEENNIVSGLMSFLRNLMEEMSVPSRFPEQFSMWMKNQLHMILTTLALNSPRINKLAQDGQVGDNLGLLVNQLTDKIVSFDIFLLNGLEKLENEPESDFNLEIGALRETISTHSYLQVISVIVWDIVTQDEPEPIDFLQALQAMYKRASVDLQAFPQTVIQSVQVLLKDLSGAEYTDFLAQLGTWSPSTSTLLTTRTEVV